LLNRAEFLVPVLMVAVMLVINPRLGNPVVWERISRNWAGVGLLALAITPIVITGGFDLSIGSVVAFAAVVNGFLWRDLGFPLGIALVGSIVAGLAAGIVNGTLVLAGISPLVVTLATLAVFRGLAYGLSGPQPVDDFPQSLATWWEGAFLGLPVPVCLFLLGWIIIYVLVHHTWMGRMIFAIGDNVQAARFAGVPVRTLTFGLYVLSGLMAGVVGLTRVCEFRSARPGEGESEVLELQAVACVVLGGVRITGGAGQVGGTVLGTITLAALLEGMARIPARWRPLITGAFLVAAAIVYEALVRLRTRWEPGAGRD
jgi:rhamnose transport system permease protein